MNTLCKRLLPATALTLGLTGAALAQPQHAVTLYDEAPLYPSGFTHFDFVNPDAPKGGTLRLAGLNGFDSFNPFIPKGNEASMIGLVYDTLTYHSPDEPFTEYGLLAEKIEKAPDNRFVRFHLRPKARFHDGTPVTAEDVVFTFNTLVSQGDPMYRHYYADIKQAVAEGPHRVRFDFTHSGNRELPLIIGQLQILPRHWWQERDLTQQDSAPTLESVATLASAEEGRSVTITLNEGENTPSAEDVRLSHEAQKLPALAAVKSLHIEDARRLRAELSGSASEELLAALRAMKVLPAKRDFTRTSLEPPLGSGPYRIASYAAGRSVRYERITDWWAADLPVTRGLYNFDAISLDYYRDMSVALEAFKAGQFDYNLEYSAKDWATGYDSPALRSGRIVQEAIPNHNPVGMQGFTFNIRRPMFQDRRVREAIALLFDFEWANKQLFFGAYKRTSSFFENSEMAARGLPDEAELKLLEPLRAQLPEEVFTEEFHPPVSDGSGIIRDRQRRAYQLLLEAGYRVENDRMVNAEGQPLAFEFLVLQANLERVILPFKRNLAELGIELQLRRVDVSQYINRLRSRDFDMTSSIWPQSNSPGNEQMEFWHSRSADSPGSRNFIGLRDPAIDALVEGLIRADSRQSLITHARALDRALLWGHYVIPNYYIDSWRVAHWTHLKRPPRTPRYDVGLMSWWIEGSAPQPVPTDAEVAE
jgi:microcin C transport system substrate-binding protein